MSYNHHLKNYVSHSSKLTLAILFVVASVVLVSCSLAGDGASRGVSGSPSYLNQRTVRVDYFRINGMVYIPTGAMLIGSNDDGVFGNFFALKNRQVTINGFWMDETEVTNSSYRGFVSQVHDATVASKLKLFVKDRNAEKKQSKVRRPSSPKPQKGRKPVTSSDATTPATPATDKNSTAKEDESSPLDLYAVPAALQDVKNLQKLRDSGVYFYDAVMKVYRPNYDNIQYKYYAFSLSKYANDAKDAKFSEDRLNRNYELKSVSVIPDTLVWVKDLSYSYNEPMATRYFSAGNYANYPVVGVTWDQAKAFCQWRTEQTKIEIAGVKAGLAFDASFRLPTETEWEYAARGGRSNSLYPWGGPYTTNKLGCFLANFKNQRGVYTEDGYAYTCDVRTYWPNDFGLYNMAGNVAEWTESIYASDGYVYLSDINPSLSEADLSVNRGKKEGVVSDKDLASKKVIKGGSWKDVAAFIQNGYRSSEDRSTPRSYIGFRTVIDLPPTSF